MRTKLEQPGSYPKAGPIGRLVRLAVGVLLILLILLDYLPHRQAITRLREGWDNPLLNISLGLLVALWLLPGMLNRGFGLKGGYRSVLGWAALALAAAVFDWVYHGSFWGPPLGWLVFLTMVAVFGHLGLSFIVAAAVGTPG